MTALLQTDGISSTEFMQNIRSKFRNPNHSQEFYIHSALNTVNFDGSFESLQRLDQMISAFRNQVGPLKPDFISDPSKVNCVLLIASFTGEFICQKTQSTEKWLNHAEYCSATATSSAPSDPFSESFAVYYANETFFPIQQLITHLSAEDGLPLTLSEEIESLIINSGLKKVAQTDKYNEEMHALQIIFQKAYPLFCGNAFQYLISLCELDYSLESLERLDELLREVRQQHHLTPDVFLKVPANYYFILFVSGYLGRIIAQESGATLKWLPPEKDSKAIEKNMRDHIAHVRVAQINHILVFTAQHICDFLFTPLIQQSSRIYAENQIDKIRSESIPLYLVKGNVAVENNLQTNIFTKLLHQAGMLCGHMFQLRYHTHTDTTVSSVSLPAGYSFIPHLDGLDNALKSLNSNSDGYAYNVLAYEAYIYLPHMRVNAIYLHICHFGEFHMNLQIIVPFYPSDSYRGFSIMQPCMAALDTLTETHMLSVYENTHAFWEGIHAFESTLPEEHQVWKKFYRPQKYPYPAPFYKFKPLAFSFKK